jgi:hypothetical protein
LREIPAIEVDVVAVGIQDKVEPPLREMTAIEVDELTVWMALREIGAGAWVEVAEEDSENTVAVQAVAPGKRAAAGWNRMQAGESGVV